MFDKELYEKRIKICKNCESFRSTTWICSECGCFLKVKARMKSRKCPKNKWQWQHTEK